MNKRPEWVVVATGDEAHRSAVSALRDYFEESDTISAHSAASKLNLGPTRFAGAIAALERKGYRFRRSIAIRSEEPIGAYVIYTVIRRPQSA